MEDPFTPGSSAPPPFLAGRSGPQEDFAAALARMAVPLAPRHIGLTGAAGMGKTALLGAFARAATDANHATMRLRGHAGEATGVIAQLAARIPELASEVRPVSRHARQALRESITEVRAMVDLGVFSAEVRSRPNTRSRLSQAAASDRALRMIAREAAHRGRGIAVLVDDAQRADAEDLRLLTEMIDAIAATDGNIVVVMAGTAALRTDALQSSPGVVERFRWHNLAPLSRKETARAFVRPFESAGLTVTAQAQAHVWEVTAGHPHVVQLVGSHSVAAWSAGFGGPVIGHQQVQRAAASAQSDLDAGILPSKWHQLDALGRDCARMIAVQTASGGGADVPVAAVADEVGVPVGTALSTLVAHGAFALNHDATTVRLAVPGLGAWIRVNRPDYKATGQLADPFTRLTRLVEQRAGRAELGLPADPALEAAMTAVLEETAVLEAADLKDAAPPTRPWAERVRRTAPNVDGLESPAADLS